MLKRCVLALLTVAVFAGVACAQDHPNFAGTWKLNLSKSNPGDYGPTSRTDEMTQDGSKFTEKVTSTTGMGDANYTLGFTADGTKVTVPPDSPQANLGNLTLQDITASWSGDSLLLAEHLNYQGQIDVAATLTYSVSSDGKTLTIKDHVSTSSMGDFDTSLVFDKQ